MLLRLLIASALITTSTTILAESYGESQMQKMVGKMDDNADKKINFKEFYEGTVKESPETYDINHDGYITSGEVKQEMTEEVIETVEEMNRLGVSEKNADATISKMLNAIDSKAEAIVKQMDFDHDNLVEANELKAYERKQFKALDKNKDGVLSAADSKTTSVYKGFPIRR